MAKIKIKDLPKDKRVSREEMISIWGGTYHPAFTDHIMHANFGSNQYYMEVARYNRLHNFRRLQSGTPLFFPPINKKSS